MNFAGIFITALALSPDAFAAALARGIARPTQSIIQAMKVGAVFGLAEGSMAALGWLLASQFADLVRAADHWIALVVLSLLGVLMIREGLASKDDDEDRPPARQTFIGTVVTAMGTSIDAAAVGVALAFAGADILIAAPVIGLTSATLSTLGYRFGPALGARLGARAELAGGSILIFIGVSIFVSHINGG